MAIAQTTSAIDPTTLLGSTAANGGAAAKNTGTEASDRFLALLVAQLKNQDPLNPLDNAQMTSQLAQINTVNGINKLNSTVEALAASLGANQYLQAASLVGHDVMAASSRLQLAGGKAEGGVVLQQAADSVKVTLSNNSGQVVRQFDLGAQPAGIANFAWDGKNDSGVVVPDGTYTMAISAVSGGQPVNVDPIAVGHVTGVIQGKEGTQLRLGALGLINLTDVLQIN